MRSNKGDGGLHRDSPGDCVGGRYDHLREDVFWEVFLIAVHWAPVLWIERLGDATPGWTNALEDDVSPDYVWGYRTVVGHRLSGLAYMHVAVVLGESNLRWCDAYGDGPGNVEDWD